MFEKLIFNLFAHALFVLIFVLIFIRLIRKNDTSYVYLLVIQFIGLVINYTELSMGKSFGLIIKSIMYLLSVVIPIFFIWLETSKKIDFTEVLYLALAYFSIFIGKENNARKYLLRLTNKYPESYKGHQILAKIYEKSRNYELALEEYEKAYEINPYNEELYLKIGKISGEIGRTDEATNIFSEILKRQPDNYEASIIFADILNAKQEYKEAVQVYLNALKYRPADYNLYYNLGMTYTMINDFSKAKECYEKAAQINSALYHAKYSLGQLELLYGDLDEAEQHFIECINAEEVEAGAYYYLARIAMIKGETDKAKNYANIAIEENPTTYEKMAGENIFMPIIDEVNKPKTSTENRKKNRKKLLSKKEILIDIHLDRTCKLVGKLNNNDIEMIENVKKNKEAEINKDDREFEE